MNLTYIKWDKELEVYYGILNKHVELIEKVNKLKFFSVNAAFFDMTKYVGKIILGMLLKKLKLTY